MIIVTAFNTMMNHLAPVLVLASALCLGSMYADALTFVPTCHGSYSRAVKCRASPTMGIPLLGRFRKKRAVDIPSAIKIGTPLPEVDVEVISSATGEATPMTIQEALGNGKCILVGMPGAFTTTCSKEHLPGYLKAAPKLKKLGIEKVAVVTTNDKFVNAAWAKDMGIIDKDEDKSAVDEYMTLISDGDGDLVKKLGLADDMGFGVGERSKRFALVVDNGVASYLAVDEGMDSCDTTSAETMVARLTPERESGGSEMDLDRNALLVVGGGALLLFLLFAVSGGNGSSSMENFELLKQNMP